MPDTQPPAHSHVHPDTGESIEFPVEMYHRVSGDQRTASNSTDYVSFKFDGFSVRKPEEVEAARGRRTGRANATAATTPEEGASKVAKQK